MQDNELFELCKEVYKRTGWEAPDTYKAEDGRPENDCQAYDSDYLLEKLPFGTELGRDSFAWIGKWERGAGSAPKKQVWQRASTPLKALLKLTVALDDAGQLKGDK